MSMRSRADDYKRTLFYRNDGQYELGPISRDKRWVALVKPRTTNDIDIFFRPAIERPEAHHGTHRRREQLPRRFHARQHAAVVRLGRRPRVCVAAESRARYGHAVGGARGALGRSRMPSIRRAAATSWSRSTRIRARRYGSWTRARSNRCRSARCRMDWSVGCSSRPTTNEWPSMRATAACRTTSMSVRSVSPRSR